MQNTTNEPQVDCAIKAKGRMVLGKEEESLV
jgi:hypothetical protein